MPVSGNRPAISGAENHANAATPNRETSRLGVFSVKPWSKRASERKKPPAGRLSQKRYRNIRPKPNKPRAQRSGSRFEIRSNEAQTKNPQPTKSIGDSERSAVCSDVVPVAGLEPARHRWRWILSPLRLPIPSHRHVRLIINHTLKFFKRFDCFFCNFLYTNLHFFNI